jgi:formylglycine-generating enzyme required for sulfatase activity
VVSPPATVAITSGPCETLAIHGGWAVRLPIIALATALLVIVPAVTSAQTANGILDIWLKVRESADAPNDQQITLYTKSKALVIGMDHYDGRSWPQLSNGIKDAEEVAKGLTAQGFEVTLKKDLKSRDLDDTLRDFFIAEGSDPNARLLLWFAGHGDTIDGEAYLVPVDAPSPKSDFEFRLKAISLRRFGEYMREAKARHVLAIFDSCFSGGVFNVARSAPPPAITLATTQPVREFISSGEAEQQVSDDGTFRKLFLDVLAGKEPDADANHDGYVTGTELGLFMHQKITNLTDNRQTPRYGKLNAYGYDRGDFVFQVGKPDVPTTDAAPTPQRILPSGEAAQAWTAIKDTKNSNVVEIFLRRYSEGFYGDLARQRLAELKALDALAQEENRLRALEIQREAEKRRVAVVSPPVTPPNPCSSQTTTVSLSSRSAQPLSAAEECALKSKDVFKECDKCPEMIVVPAGSFTMGSPSSEPERGDDEAQVRVTIAKPFAVGQFTVTFDEWDQCVAEGGCDGYRPNDNGWGRGRRPAINVSWDDAQKYVAWLSRKTGKTYRLLSEAEREYVTRAGTTTPFWWGSSITPSQADYNGSAEPYKGGGSKGEYRKKTMPVDSFSPNPWGLYNVHGNVWEWAQDCWNDSNSGNPGDGSARTRGDCSRRFLRGGSWEPGPRLLRAAFRYWGASINRLSDVGFRLARTLTP